MREVRCKLKFLKVLALALGALTIAPIGQAGQPEVPRSQNLAADARAATADNLPILLSFSTRNCGYCELLEENFLRPMVISGLYEDKILIRKVMIDEGQSLVDFNGEKIDADRLAYRYKVRVVPTLLFVNAAGQEVAERMVGINTPELFGGYLERNIDTALRQVRGAQLANAGPFRLSSVRAPHAGGDD